MENVIYEIKGPLLESDRSDGESDYSQTPISYKLSDEDEIRAIPRPATRQEVRKKLGLDLPTFYFNIH